MTRWAAGVEYDGTFYHGWQMQVGRESIQSVLERALSTIASHRVEISASGRTDAGVHAFGQVVHFDSDAGRDARAWLFGGNSNLPADISLRWIQQASNKFHARHSAVARSYRYVVHNNRARSALLRNRAAWVPMTLNEVVMDEAAQGLLGECDFSSFRASECQSRTPVRCVTDIKVWRRGSFVVLDIRANAFLHHMVRNIMGTLIQIGLGNRPETWLSEVLSARDRRLAGPTAPAGGLYFTGPEYPSSMNLPLPPIPWFPA